jgi:hypothetical protein
METRSDDEQFLFVKIPSIFVRPDWGMYFPTGRDKGVHQAASALSRVCLHVTRIGSLVREKFDDHSLVIFHPRVILNGFSCTKWGNNYGVNLTLEIDSIYLIFRKVQALEINLREMLAPELSARGWDMHLSTRPYAFDLVKVLVE